MNGTLWVWIWIDHNNTEWEFTIEWQKEESVCPTLSNLSFILSICHSIYCPVILSFLQYFPINTPIALHWQTWGKSRIQNIIVLVVGSVDFSWASFLTLLTPFLCLKLFWSFQSVALETELDLSLMNFYWLPVFSANWSSFFFMNKGDGLICSRLEI